MSRPFSSTFSTVLQQQQQHVEYLWRNSDFFAIMGQSALLHIKPKYVGQCAEFVECSSFRPSAHSRERQANSKESVEFFRGLASQLRRSTSLLVPNNIL